MEDDTTDEAVIDHDTWAEGGCVQLSPQQAAFRAFARADAELLAEMVSAAFIGIAVSRHTGAFPSLSAASSDQVAGLLGQAFGALIDSSAGAVLSQ